MDAKEFWAAVREEKAKIIALLTQGVAGQPPVTDGVCYITSRKSRSKGVNPGAVTQANFFLAAQRIVEETHELATGEQIAAFVASQQAEASAIRARELSRRAQVVMHVDGQMQPLAEQPRRK